MDIIQTSLRVFRC